MSDDDSPLVVVVLGTDHHPFARPLAWISELAQDGSLRFHVQHGSTPLPPGLDGTPMLGHGELSALLERASVVVTHGGPGSVMDAREHGHVPVVVPRDPRFGEHVDDHQIHFARRLALTGEAVVAESRHQLLASIGTMVVAHRRLPSAVRPGRTDAVFRFEELVEGLVRG